MKVTLFVLGQPFLELATGDDVKTEGDEREVETGAVVLTRQDEGARRPGFHLPDRPAADGG